MKNKNPFKIYTPDIQSYISLNEERVYYDKNKQNTENDTEDTNVKVSTFSKINILFLIILISLLVLSVRLSHLQIINGNYYQLIADKNKIRMILIKPSRGIIFDRNNEVLVKNIPNYLMEFIPVDLPDNENTMNKLIESISKITGMSPLDIQKKIENSDKQSYEPVILAENISYDNAIQTKLLNSKYPGIILGVESNRKYLNSDVTSLSHILGYLGRINADDLKKETYSSTDMIGRIGLEAEYEDILKGEGGKQQIIVDALGREKDIIANHAAIPGNNLILTIDLEMQNHLEKFLAEILKKNKKNKGSALALDPNNGEILALVNLPSFDNNMFSMGISQEEFQKLVNDPDGPLFNRAIKGTYPSGSIIKPILAAAALQEGIVTQWTIVQSVGGIKINQWFFPDWKKGGHGATNITKALAESVNTYFYYIGGGYDRFNGLGLDRITKYLQLSGVGNMTGIDLPDESSGLVPTKEWKEETKKEKWYIGDTYHLSIGQGDLLVTPLQAANWTALIANSGTLYQPHMVKEIRDSNNNIIKKIDPIILQKNIFSKENIDIVKLGLLEAVLYGSAKSLNDLPIKVAGKTGTAEWSNKFLSHAWFTSFAPYDNPKIVLTILIEEGGEGSQVATPVAKEFYNWWSKYNNFVDK